MQYRQFKNPAYMRQEIPSQDGSNQTEQEPELITLQAVKETALLK